ncbi:MAG: glycosyltransferase [Candidatus Margulisiibacteriota bacterium]|jgi:glycosyltransferase involved in cell wall biosynthesis
MLSICMIVKNEAENLKLTLPALVKLAAEVIIVDTGSTDATIETAESLGATVRNFEWINDFAAARNFSLSLAKSPWIMWLDADEYLKEEELAALLKSLNEAPAEHKAYQLILTESPYGQTVRGTSYPRVKVFRRGEGIHFERTINEQVVDAKGKLVDGEILPIVIYHWGRFLTAQRMAEKKARYYRMYENHLRDQANDPYVNFLLADLLKEDKRLPEAYDTYAKAVEFAGYDGRLKKDALIKMAEIGLKIGKFKESFALAKEVLALDPEAIAPKSVIATLLIGVEQLDPAIALMEEALQKSEETVDPIRDKIIPRVVLADAYAKKGDQVKTAKYQAEAKALEEKYNARPAE